MQCFGRTYPPRPIIVFGLASPAPVWPLPVTVRTYTHSDDFVPLLSLGRSYVGPLTFSGVVSRSYLPFPASHAFAVYAKDSPFVHDLRARLGLEPTPSWANQKYMVAGLRR